MSKNYSVARVAQHTAAGIGKSERHIERKNESYENMNVNLTRTPMNVHFKGCGEQTYNARLDELVAEGAVSLRGLKKDAKVFDEMIFDVNTAYFEERGGYEYAKQFYEEAFHCRAAGGGERNPVIEALQRSGVGRDGQGGRSPDQPLQEMGLTEDYGRNRPYADYQILQPPARSLL